MKTIFLFLRQGISNRNLLRTDFLKTLKETPEVRTVIISPIGDEPEFRKEFEAPNVCVEKWPRTKVGFLEKRLKNLKDYIWVSRGLTQAIRVRRLAQLGKAGLMWRDWIGKFARLLRVSETKINHWELMVYKSRSRMAELYDRYKPDLVVFTRPFGTNMHAMKEAKKRGVWVLCQVESWDNFISKGPLSVIPDQMAVWNESMKAEAEALHGFSGDRVDVVGAPQFDLYAERDKFLSRQEFFDLHGLDSERKLLTYGGSTEGFIPDELRIIELICAMIETDRFEMPCQLLIRLHPITSPGLQAEYFRRFSARPNVFIQKPGRSSNLHDGWDPTWADMLMMASTLKCSDVILNVASTLTIDAVALDRPVVCVAFAEGLADILFRNIYERSHYRQLIDTGGLHLVRNQDELVGTVINYLKDPSLDAAGRQRLREKLCYRLDGRSAQRAAEVALRELGLSIGSKGRIDRTGHGTRFLSLDFR